jgi:hypothetical protein
MLPSSWCCSSNQQFRRLPLLSDTLLHVLEHDLHAMQQAPPLSDLVELMEEAADLGVAVTELSGLRERAVVAEAWIRAALEHMRRFPATSAQPPEALAAAQHIIQVRLSDWPHGRHAVTTTCRLDSADHVLSNAMLIATMR